MAERFEQRKDRTFLRAIQGAGNLKDELARQRAIPRVQRAEEVKFIDGTSSSSRCCICRSHPGSSGGWSVDERDVA